MRARSRSKSWMGAAGFMALLACSTDVAAQDTDTCEARAARRSAGIGISHSPGGTRVHRSVIESTYDRQAVLGGAIGVAADGSIPLSPDAVGNSVRPPLDDYTAFLVRASAGARYRF